MAYDEKLADRIRTTLSEMNVGHIEEKKMFRGMSFLVNGKMCLSVSGDEFMLGSIRKRRKRPQQIQALAHWL